MKTNYIDYIIDFLKEEIKSEQQNIKEARDVAGINSCGACMAMGALEAYRTVLEFISDEEHNEKP